MFNDMKIVDCHIHYSSNIPVEEMIRILDYCDTDVANIVVVPDRAKLSAVQDALILKHKLPDRIYVFASLDASNYFIKKKTLGKAMAKYALRMREAGCDGIKMIEGKPQIRKMLNVPPFDESVWEPYFAFMEDTAFPILWHVNDPEEFWDKDKIPKWAMQQDWLYDETYVNNEQQYEEVLNVLKKHPDLKIIFAHFFFLSKQLDRLSEILDKYQNVYVDLTPGIEMYINFSENKEKATAFFEKYQDRIMYGTDIGTKGVVDGKSASLEEEKKRADLVKRYVSSKADFIIDKHYSYLMHDNDFTLSPLGLSKKIQKKIFSLNFLDFMGHTPYPVDSNKVLREIRKTVVKLCLMKIGDKSGTEYDFASLKKAYKQLEKI
jgi:predicted TIM-barrel fold metal-dependent hydrolase